MLTIESASDPFWNDAQHETIFLNVKFAEFNEIMPFTATPYDDMPYGVELFNRAKAGEFGEVRSFSEHPAHVNATPSQDQPNTTGTQQA
jgi:hypothetical protein